MATILECSELTKKYGSHRAVDNLNLQIERGRVYALLGPNGSGKSTFMKMAAGLALSRDASLIMLDEPLNGIDIIARDQILETMQKYCSPTKTFLVSSHLVDDLERMTDDAIFMKNGGLVMCGKVDELTKHHGKTMTELYKEVYSDCVM